MEKQRSYEIGCLLIHGFCGSTKEVEYLAKSLEERGLFTVCTKLKGHTGDRKDLSKTTYNDWIKSAEDSLIEIREKCEKIIIIGFFNGGINSCKFECRIQNGNGCFISTPVYLFDFKRILKNLFGHTTVKGKESFSKKIIRLGLQRH